MVSKVDKWNQHFVENVSVQRGAKTVLQNIFCPFLVIHRICNVVKFLSMKQKPVKNFQNINTVSAKQNISKKCTSTRNGWNTQNKKKTGRKLKKKKDKIGDEYKNLVKNLRLCRTERGIMELFHSTRRLRKFFKLVFVEKSKQKVARQKLLNSFSQNRRPTQTQI